MRRARLPIVLTLCLAACAGGSDAKALTDEGYQALGSSDFNAALDDFEAALEVIGDDPSHAQFRKAAMGAIQAKAHVDPDAAASDFLALPDRGVELTDRDYSSVGNWLAAAGNHLQAIHVMDAGLERWEDSKSLHALLERIRSAAADEDGQVAKELEGLGYL